MSKIEWTNETWNPVVGCSKVSPGCKNCYAEKMAFRQGHMGTPKYQGIADDFGWTGNIFCDEPALEKPLHWKKPRMIFVCSMGDLFHKAVPFEFIDKVFAVMALCPQHTFQVLTKRAERMMEYLTKKHTGNWSGPVQTITRIHREAVDIDNKLYYSPERSYQWPLPNVWLGVTAENQEQADKRIPLLLQTPAAVRFVSVEPMLGSMDFGFCPDVIAGICNYETADSCDACGKGPAITQIDWVICGSESGPNARYCDIENIRSVVKQCKSANVPVFVKQIHLNGKAKAIKDINQFPEDLRIREFPKETK
jgi:protein gp37